MATFKVEATKISKIWDHPNADRLSLAQVEGMTFQFCVKKDEFQVGSAVVYFPLDAVMPDALVAHFGIANFLAGGKRVKTVKLRGSISQGFVASAASVSDYLVKNLLNPLAIVPNLGLTDALGVTKWEPPVTMQANAKLTPLNIPAYDIEGCDRYPEIVAELMKEPVVYITEKVEGMNMFAQWRSDGQRRVAQRNFYIESLDPENPHSFDQMANTTLFPLLALFNNHHSLKCEDRNLRFRAEFTGPGSQGNYYEILDQRAYVFEMDVDGVPIDAEEFDALFKTSWGVGWSHCIQDVLRKSGMVGSIFKKYIYVVPPVFVGRLSDFLAGRTIQEASNGPSAINPGKLREGIVIRPARERDIPGFGRLILKQRSPEYLAKTEN